MPVLQIFLFARIKVLSSSLHLKISRPICLFLKKTRKNSYGTQKSHYYDIYYNLLFIFNFNVSI